MHQAGGLVLLAVSVLEWIQPAGMFLVPCFGPPDTRSGRRGRLTPPAAGPRHGCDAAGLWRGKRQERRLERGKWDLANL